MNNKTLKLLGIFFVILLGIAVFPWIQAKYFPQKNNAELTFVPFTKDTTTSIVLSDTKGNVTLSKDGNSWKVASYSASQEKVDILFQNLALASAGPLVSSNPAHASDYGISSESATVMTLSRGSDSMDVLIGSAATNGNGFYAAKKDSSNIYQMNGGLADVISTKLLEWQDRSVVRVPRESFAEVRVSGKKPFDLKKTEMSETDIHAMDRIFSLTASDFYTTEDAQRVESTSEKREVTFLDKDGKSLASFTTFSDEAYYLVTVPGKTDLYKVAGYNLDDFFKLGERQ